MRLYSNEAEMAVLGAMMDRKPQEAYKRASFLKAKDFYHGIHRNLFEYLCEANEEGKPVDPISVAEAVDGIEHSYLTGLVINAPSVGLVVGHADIIKDYSNRRDAFELTTEVRQAIEDGEKTLSVLSGLSDKVDSMIASYSHGQVVSIDDLIEITMREMESSSQGVKVGLETGIPEVDERLGDSFLAFGQITVLGGLSKNGKTLLGNTITSRLKLDEDEVGHIFSIEMPVEAMFNAVISASTGVPANFYRKQDYYAKMYPSMYDQFVSRWGAEAQRLRSSGTFTFDGENEVDAEYICANMRKQASLARQRGKVLRFVMIDHLHRMNFHSGNQNMTYGIREAVRKIKNTASELGIAVLMLAQLNNKAEKEEPTSFHILDSSSVRHELQAFIGVKMYREEGETFFGIYADSQRFADAETRHDPAFVKLINGVMRSLPEHQKNWRPSIPDEQRRAN